VLTNSAISEAKDFSFVCYFLRQFFCSVFTGLEVLPVVFLALEEGPLMGFAGNTTECIGFHVVLHDAFTVPVVVGCGDDGFIEPVGRG
jgi:hypothetical protein